MKRISRAALFAALAALCAVGALPQPPARAGIALNFSRPEFFPGFEPILPDAFGLSPGGKYLVYRDVRGLHLLRRFGSVEILRLLVSGDVRPGFDAEDRRFYLLEDQRASFRFRFFDPDRDEADLLLDVRARTQPEIRTNFDGSVNTFIEREAALARSFIFDRYGAVTHRRSDSPLVFSAINQFEDAVAFGDALPTGVLRIQVVDARTGKVTFRDSGRDIVEAGFAPLDPKKKRHGHGGFGGHDGPPPADDGRDGDRDRRRVHLAPFVTARATSINSFRIRMVDAVDGRSLVNRSFNGPANAGFTPDGRLLGIRSRIGLREETFLFDTRDGRRVTPF